MSPVSEPDGVLLLAAILACAFSGVIGLFLPAKSRAGERIAAGLLAAGALAGVIVTLRVLAGAAAVRIEVPSPLTTGALLLIADPLSAAFLLPVFLVSGLGGIYALGYWPEREHPETGRRLRFFYGLLSASMALVAVSRSGVLFLIAWEVMALSAFFAATVEDREKPVRDAGWVYLIATHSGTLFLFAMVALLHARTGSFEWKALETGSGQSGLDTAIFLCALVGFGFKAGIVPFHFWLPGAHANAPSHVSAMMSGVMLKMGVYGILRVSSLFANPPAGWGTALLLIGAVTALVGVALAMTQSELKRLLAYSSIENIGIIFLGLGMALLGASHAAPPDWAILGLAACVLHVWNHSLFKPLLFFAAGAVLHATGQRSMDAMGGLLRRMPRTGLAFAVGSLSVSGLPPLNGFASEWLLYVALFTAFSDSTHGTLLPGLAIPALALVGGLALASFVKAFGIVFLGAGRRSEALHAHDAGLAMWGPMAALGAACVLAGTLAAWIAPALDGVAGGWFRGGTGGRAVAALAPLSWLAVMGAGLFGAALLLWLVFRVLSRRTTAPSTITWDCGYAQPSERMQYTGRSFSEWIAERFLPRSAQPLIDARGPEGLFPRGARFRSESPDPFSHRVYQPILEACARRFTHLRFLQQGRLRIYLIYILVTLLLLLGWAAVRVIYPA
jgi:hydrogenase-4 component B